MDMSTVLTYEELFVRCRKLIAPLLSPAAESVLMSMHTDFMSLAIALKHIFAHQIPKFGHQVYVTSVDEFISATSAVFSTTFSDHFLMKARHFDGISGCDGSPSNVFLQLECLDSILERLAQGISGTAERLVLAESSSSSSSTASTTQRPTDQLTLLQMPIPVADGDSAQEDTAGTSAQGSSQHCPIINIELRGRTIRSAWRSNDLLRGIEAAATEPVRQDPLWAPSRTTTLAVYHGTPGPQTSDHEFHEFALALAHFDTTSQVLRGSVSPNQVAPVHSSMPVIWTSFSPFRSFLWASFVAEVLSDIPQATAAVGSYDCPRPPSHSHRGVRLLEFRPQLCGPDDEHVYVMPNGIQDEWGRLAVHSAGVAARAARNAKDTSGIWGIFSRLHRRGGECWPHKIHCHEVPHQSAMLRPFSRQMWRSVWHGAGISELNRGRTRTFSISLQIEEPTPTTQKPSAIGTPSKGGETLGKRLWNSLNCAKKSHR